MLWALSGNFDAFLIAFGGYISVAVIAFSHSNIAIGAPFAFVAAAYLATVILFWISPNRILQAMVALGGVGWVFSGCLAIQAHIILNY